MRSHIEGISYKGFVISLTDSRLRRSSCDGNCQGSSVAYSNRNWRPKSHSMGICKFHCTHSIFTSCVSCVCELQSNYINETRKCALIGRLNVNIYSFKECLLLCERSYLEIVKPTLFASTRDIMQSTALSFKVTLGLHWGLWP